MKTIIKIAAQKSSLPILNCILFTGNTARATDLEVYGNTTGAWHFDVPRMVEVKLVKAALALNSKKPMFDGTKLNGVELVAADGMDPADFPLELDAWMAGGFELDFCGADLNAAIARVTPAMSEQDVRYYLNGLMVNSDGVVCATDGHRLHVEHDAFIAGTDKKFEAIIPRVMFDLSVKIDGITLSATHCQIVAGDCILTSKLIDGKFPDYQRVIPSVSEKPTAIKFNGAQTKCADNVLKFSKANKEKFHCMALHSKDGAIIASSRSGQEFAFADCFDGESVDIGVEASYLRDAMQAAYAGEIRLSDSTSSILISSGRFQAVVMPMRM